MHGIVVEDFRDGGKRLIELGGHLHEVAGHGSTAQTIVVAIREDTVEGMSKLMEERGHLIPSEQRGLAFGCFRIVAHVEDDGQLVITVALLGKTIHPCAAALGRTAEVITIEERLRFVVFVEDLKDLHIWMIGRNVGALLESEPVGAIGCIEHTIDQDAVNVEI